MAADPKALTRLSAVLPEVMIEYWERFGFSVFQDGFFQLVNPEFYTASLDLWLKGTELEGKDEYFVIQRTVFGVLEVWGRRTGYGFSVRADSGEIHPVSYTHLTLPTILLV